MTLVKSIWTWLQILFICLFAVIVVAITTAAVMTLAAYCLDKYILVTDDNLTE